ncbi:MAG: pyrroloquinoline quinone biosynthesis protein PqqB [Bacteroidetes bacterium]|nr:MAG: pyrroloquinoline quinone biosynthesis protein PqqB [Bacteroidota bacterium]
MANEHMDEVEWIECRFGPYGTYLVVLGVAQDAGYPQAGCNKDCCRPYWEGLEEERYTSCLAIVDEVSGQAWMFDATPDFKFQMKNLLAPEIELAGIFLTHAHIGHYTGLMHLGREVMGAPGVPVYAMPKMTDFLENNGPWSQLVALNNIDLHPLSADSAIVLNDNYKVTPFVVPHRDEFSETVGYRIEGPDQSVLFIPDINKWEVWERDIVEEIKNVDLAFLDATFYKNGEIPGRDMSEIPHPFIEESMQKFRDLPEEEKAKVHFIHFNHTNPVLRNTPERQHVLDQGFKVAEELMVLQM